MLILYCNCYVRKVLLFGVSCYQAPKTDRLQWRIDKSTGRQYDIDDVDNFEWDDNKAARNYIKHDVSFEEAAKVFLDPWAKDDPDDRKAYGEERFVHIGMAGHRLLTVIYTERGAKIRIISARKATKHEQNYYRETTT